MDKLNFLTAGMPLTTGNKSYPGALKILEEMNLDGLELEFVHGVRISDKNKEVVKNSSLVKTIHAPFYINLNSKEEEKIEASVQRIIETAEVADEIGAFSITYHAGFYLGMDKETVYKNIQKQTDIITSELKNKNITVWIRPETTGKATQWGDLDEIINLSKEFEDVLPCIDFAHLHARYNGISNTYDEFARIFDKLATELGSDILNKFHAHIAGIAYSEKGEKHHLNLDESDFNYKDLLKAFKDFSVKGAIVCESPNIETDCKILKEYYKSL
ncbi:MAG: TIM barrel protein [Candidatus Gastranaerophilales bacterium]|nr:TIM barrel protein [Candidatus Gastranaerophilales bacterium]